MVKQTDKHFANKKIKSNDNRNSTAVNYASQMPSYSNKFNDELIVSLADAYENKRARQVFEWENIRRKHFQQTT